MAPRSVSPRLPQDHASQRLDLVAPTAIASVEARRQAQRTLRDIDALLALDGPATDDRKAPRRSMNHSSGEGSTDPSVAGTPGPGAYDTQKERTQWRRHASVALHRTTPAKDKKTAVLRYEHTRADKTPGPGAYDVTAADRVTKPRVNTATFRAETTTPAKDRDQAVPRHDDPLEPAKADKWLSRYTEPKGAVAYRTATVAATTREQRDKLRRIRLEKTCHARVGFYDVRFALTERRTGALGVVAMDKSATTCARGSTRHVQARTRRQLRAWHSGEPTATAAAPQVTDTRGSESPRPQRGAAASTTVQWQRARARVLLHQRDAKQIAAKCHGGSDDSGNREDRRDLVAHAMARHSGRDTVRCPRKNLRLTTAFTSPLPKERWQCHATRSPSSAPQSRGAPLVAYDKMQGRGEFTVDARGVYLLGLEA